MLERKSIKPLILSGFSSACVLSTGRRALYSDENFFKKIVSAQRSTLRCISNSLKNVTGK